jgi:hypothetical protein
VDKPVDGRAVLGGCFDRFKEPVGNHFVDDPLNGSPVGSGFLGDGVGCHPEQVVVGVVDDIADGEVDHEFGSRVWGVSPNVG